MTLTSDQQIQAFRKKQFSQRLDAEGGHAIARKITAPGSLMDDLSSDAGYSDWRSLIFRLQHGQGEEVGSYGG
jgi:hypothetical protein